MLRSSRNKALNFSRLTKCTARDASGTFGVSTGDAFREHKIGGADTEQRDVHWS